MKTKFNLEIDEDDNINLDIKGDGHDIVAGLITMMEQNDVVAWIIMKSSEYYENNYSIK